MKRKAIVKKPLTPDTILLYFSMLVFSTIITLEEMDLYSVHAVNLMLSSNYLCLTFCKSIWYIFGNVPEQDCFR